ncbi:protein FRA10AC1 homolog isoform X2 [Macrobrachium rosenbergii]|uniref:protein FRA10AC1 homolog isoform X2 n=1 Tax=Macrobrachium rosenbergii TaxID=79674 RepID=UPI0034D66432
MSLKNSLTGYDSAFEEDEKLRNKQRERHAFLNKERRQKSGLPSKSLLSSSASNEEGRRLRYQMSNLTAYERHKLLINHYVLYYPGSTALLQRDTSKDKCDIDVIRENHRFLWDEKDTPDTWECQLAKKYFDKLFKEYCICDLSRYKENKDCAVIALTKLIIIISGRKLQRNLNSNIKKQKKTGKRTRNTMLKEKNPQWNRKEKNALKKISPQMKAFGRDLRQLLKRRVEKKNLKII